MMALYTIVISCQKLSKFTFWTQMDEGNEERQDENIIEEENPSIPSTSDQKISSRRNPSIPSTSDQHVPVKAKTYWMCADGCGLKTQIICGTCKEDLHPMQFILALDDEVEKDEDELEKFEDEDKSKKDNHSVKSVKQNHDSCWEKFHKRKFPDMEVHIPRNLPYLTKTIVKGKDNRRQCTVCDRKSSFECVMCDKGLCLTVLTEHIGEGRTNCWEIYHRKESMDMRHSNGGFNKEYQYEKCNNNGKTPLNSRFCAGRPSRAKKSFKTVLTTIL